MFVGRTYHHANGVRLAHGGTCARAHLLQAWPADQPCSPVLSSSASPPPLQPPVMRVLLLAPLNLAALYLADLDETKLSAGVGLAASAALLLGAQQAAVKAGRNLI